MQGATMTNESTHGGRSNKKVAKKKAEVFDGITKAEARLDKMAQRANDRLERVVRAIQRNERLAKRAERNAGQHRLDAGQRFHGNTHKSNASLGDESDSYFDGGRHGHQTLDHTFNNDSEEDSGSYTSPERKAHNTLTTEMSRNKHGMHTMTTEKGPGGLRTLQPTPLGQTNKSKKHLKSTESQSPRFMRSTLYGSPQ